MMNLKDAQVRTTVLQSKLYQAAKCSPTRRFHHLYDKIHREDVLLIAWDHVRKNGGAPGTDGVSIADVKEHGVEEYLALLGSELSSQTYRPQPVRRVEISKGAGKTRKLGIPTVRDRIVQAAAKLILEPIFEADFQETSYGFRPGMGQPEALAAVKQNAYAGYRHVVDADIEGFFDNLDHERMMAALRRRICDGAVLRLIYRWLKAGVEIGYFRDDTDQGTPQGGVISPLLANVYLHGLDVAASAKTFPGRMTRFADDLVIQCGTREHAEKVMEWLSTSLEQIGLRLSMTKTQLVVDSVEGFDFLGFHHRRVIDTTGNRRKEFFMRWPSRRACQRFRDRIKEVLIKGVRVQTADDWREKRDALNAYIRGWGQYFRNGNGTVVLKKLDWYAHERVARYLARCQPKGKKRKKRLWQSFLEWMSKRGSLLRLARADAWKQPNPYRGTANVRWKAV
jgi:RNA-directed DNA polymerase